MIFINLNNYEVNINFLSDVSKNNYHNLKIISYFEKYFKFRTDKIGVINSLKNCNKVWTVDTYSKIGVRDFLGTNLCHNKFCNNCKNVKQNARLMKYTPELSNYDDSLFHLVLTIPNCKGSDLRTSINKMTACYRHLTRFLSSDKKISGVDFSSYGYLGAVRSLEITFKGDFYHPHFHVAIAFKNLKLVGQNLNLYSFSNVTDYVRYFSDFEILIQKVWYLLYNDIVVTKKNIDNLDVGFSCILDKFDKNDYFEVFKYLTKDFDDSGNILTYDNFVTLYEQTHSLKQIQGYGVFYRVISEDLIDTINSIYDDLVDYLNKQDSPILERFSPDYLSVNNYYLLISRRKIYNSLVNAGNCTDSNNL